mgnify:FL=1
MSTVTETPESENTDFLTSSQVAKRLGLSMATVQKLVDNNTLQAWRTFGGHRRIALTSVLNYQKANSFDRMIRPTADRRTKVVMVVESNELAQSLRDAVSNGDLPVQVSFFESLTEALLELLNEKHELLVLQTHAPRDQQEKFLEILQKFVQSRHTLAHILILSPEKDLLTALKPGASPASIQVLDPDVSGVWLSGYLAGFVAQRRT